MHECQYEEGINESLVDRENLENKEGAMLKSRAVSKKDDILEALGVASFGDLSRVSNKECN